MPDNPHPSVLDPHGPIEWQSSLSEPLAVLSDIANFGSNLIVRLWPSTPRGAGDAVLVMHLARLIVMHVDGVRILLEKGAGPTALLQLRSLLEVSLLIDWAASGDTEEKAKYLMASNWRKERARISALIPGTVEHTDFAAYISQPTSATQSANAQARVAALNNQLAGAAFQTIDAAFNTIKGNGHEPEWYDVFVRHQRLLAGQLKGQKFSIRALADEVGRLPEYRYLYSKMSNDAHGSSFSSSVSFGMEGGAQTISMHNVRRVHDFGWMFKTASALANRAYHLLLQRYRPNDKGLSRRYISEWKPVLDQDWRVTEAASTQRI